MDILKAKAFNLAIPCIVLITLVTCLIFVMMSTTRFNAHPDEHLHFKAAQYYMSYWLPPRVGDAKAEYTYSNFGISYLDEPDVVYFLAGKFSEALKFTGLSPFLLTRAFNFGLFIALFLFLLKISFDIGVPFYAILLLSPQIWYVFGYFNGDAFSFFVGSCLVLELARDIIRDPEKAMPRIEIGVWLGLLLLVKRNYYVLILLMVGVVLWHSIFYSKVGQRRVLAKKWLKVLLVAVLIAMPKIAYQQWVNEFHLSEKRVAQMEKMAAAGFKPSQVTASYSPWHVDMRAKGRPLRELLTVHQWHSISFKSMVGVYGWMDIFSPSWYYGAMFLLYILLFVRACLPRRPFEWSELTLTALEMLLMVAITVASLLNSWTVAFQAQGRYLFPMFCIFLILLAYKWERLPQKFFYSAFLTTGLLSLGNFIFVGLGNLSR